MLVIEKSRCSASFIQQLESGPPLCANVRGVDPEESELARAFRGIKKAVFKGAAIEHVVELAELEKKPKGNK